MQLELQLDREQVRPDALLQFEGQSVAVVTLRNIKARRYILRVTPAGFVRVTIPRGGSKAFALEFVKRHTAWIEKRLRQQHRCAAYKAWTHGTPVLFRGEMIPLCVETGTGEIILGDLRFKVPQLASELRPAVELHLRRLAVAELTARTMELARMHQCPVRRVSVRNQRSRWGSCSVRGCISLNWRLIQAPASVADYIILHELMHMKEMNHSPRFWRLVAEVCPWYEQAENWLKDHDELLKHGAPNRG